MGAVTSRESPVAGCRVRSLGMLRYQAVASREFVARWFPDGVDADALARAPVVDFDRRDDLQARWLAGRGATGAPPRHLVPASSDFATSVRLGMGWGLLPGFQSDEHLAAGALVPLGGPPVDVPLFWQQWNLTSPLLDAIAAELVGEARRVLEARYESLTRTTSLPLPWPRPTTACPAPSDTQFRPWVTYNTAPPAPARRGVTNKK